MNEIKLPEKDTIEIVDQEQETEIEECEAQIEYYKKIQKLLQ